MDDEQYLIERLNTKKQQLLDDYNFMSEQAFLAITQMSRAELEQLKEQHQVLFIESNGDVLYPEFQLVEGQVSLILSESLPRLYKARSDWDISFWLLQEHSVTLVSAEVGAKRLNGISLHEVLELGRKCDEQSERFRDKPIDALRQKKEELFKILIQDWLATDCRRIPTKPLIE